MVVLKSTKSDEAATTVIETSRQRFTIIMFHGFSLNFFFNFNILRLLMDLNRKDILMLPVHPAI